MKNNHEFSTSQFKKKIKLRFSFDKKCRNWRNVIEYFQKSSWQQTFQRFNCFRFQLRIYSQISRKINCYQTRNLFRLSWKTFWQQNQRTKWASRLFSMSSWSQKKTKWVFIRLTISWTRVKCFSIYRNYSWLSKISLFWCMLWWFTFVFETFNTNTRIISLISCKTFQKWSTNCFHCSKSWRFCILNHFFFDLKNNVVQRQFDRKYNVKRRAVQIWLEYLIKNHFDYMKIFIDYNRISLFLENDFILLHVRTLIMNFFAKETSFKQNTEKKKIEYRIDR